MGSIVSKIVLTGGPCAGKTRSLTKIEEHFEELGYKVIIVPETATILINGGIRCFGNKALDDFEFQNYILNMQLQHERFFEECAKSFKEDNKCIIIYDRGTLDGNAYIDNDGFNRLLQYNNLSKIDLLDHYDTVIHLVTAAKGAEKYYTLDNNGARTETIDEARVKDELAMISWSEHTNLHIVDNSTDFDEKINRVINIVSKSIGSNIVVRKQRKYLVDISNLSQEFYNYYSPIEIEQSYMIDNEYEKRLRRRNIDGVNKYYYTVQSQDRKGSSIVHTDRKISENEYYELLNSNNFDKTITKIRYSFVYNNEQYRLDIFDNMCILESNYDSNLILPSGINILSEITNNEEYYNANLASTKSKVKKLTNTI